MDSERYAYATALSLTLTLWGFSVVRPFPEPRCFSGGVHGQASMLSRGQHIATWFAIAMLVPQRWVPRTLIGGEDWNGSSQHLGSSVLDRNEPMSVPLAAGARNLLRCCSRRDILVSGSSTKECKLLKSSGANLWVDR